MIKIDVVLHPTDFSEVSRHAIPYAMEFAVKYSAKLILLHVLDLPYSAISMAEEAMREAQEKLHDLIPADKRDRLDMETVVLRGAPCEEVIKLAKERSADIIIIGAHGEGGWRHAILGDTAEKVVRKAPCPVLTIRHPEHEFIVPDAEEESAGKS